MFDTILSEKQCIVFLMEKKHKSDTLTLDPLLSMFTRYFSSICESFRTGIDKLTWAQR